MNLKKLHTENKAVQTSVLFEPTEKVISMQIAKGETLKEHISKIFDKLYRIPTGNVHNVKGFGLGLSYVKALVDLFGWSLDVTSQYGEGSEFRVTINR